MVNRVGSWIPIHFNNSTQSLCDFDRFDAREANLCLYLFVYYINGMDLR